MPTATVGPLRDVSAFTLQTLDRGDDNSVYTDIGFTVNFYGTEYNKLYVNTNGSVSFAQTYSGYLGDSMRDVAIPILAAFSADVDTRGADGGTVTYGRGKIDGFDAFVVTWQDVSYFEPNAAEKDDKRNTFQLLILDRDSAGNDIYDVEYNYAQVRWESGESGVFGLNGQPPEVGYSAGTGQSGTFREVPGSSMNGNLIDGGAAALVGTNSTTAVDGRFVFFVRAGVIGNVAPTVVLTDAPTTIGAGVEWVASGKVNDDNGGWTVVVDYGDGSAPEQVTANADGVFELRHTFATQGTRQVKITAIDSACLSGESVTRVFVLPTASEGKVKKTIVEVAAPGQTVWPRLEESDGTEVTAQYERSANATGEVSVFLALYDGAPVDTNRKGTFLDIQVGGANPQDKITVTISSELLKGNFEFGYFDHTTGAWTNLLARPDLAEVTVDAATGTMTVKFLTVSIFEGTVFTVSLPSGSGVQTTTNVRGTTASAGDTSGLGRSVSFTSNTQLAVALTSSQTNQLAGSASAQGSQGGAANGAGPSGGPKDATTASSSSAAVETTPGQGRGRGSLATKGEMDDATLWQLLTGDELLLRLWAQGADLSALMAPGDGGSVGIVVPEEAAEMPVVQPRDLALQGWGEAPEVFAFDAVPMAAPEANDDSAFALATLAVLGVGAWRREEKRSRKLQPA